MNHLAGRVYTGIRSAGTNHANGMIGNPGQRLLDTPLDGASLGLALPAEVIRTVIFNAKGDAHTGLVRYTGCRRRGGLLLCLTGWQVPNSGPGSDVPRVRPAACLHGYTAVQAAVGIAGVRLVLQSACPPRPSVPRCLLRALRRVYCALLPGRPCRDRHEPGQAWC